MAGVQSSGVILHRFRSDGSLEVFLAHPGGPFWAKKDDGAWSIPKGLIEEHDTDLRAVATREFREEIGVELECALEILGEFKQPSGKVIHAWTGVNEINPAEVHSNTFELEWPPKTGIIREFPEVDRADWFLISDARKKLLKGQQPILDALISYLSYDEANETPADRKGQFSLL
jgi:predicted NUDIX family NTP pyrophosphohydrolase